MSPQPPPGQRPRRLNPYDDPRATERSPRPSADPLGRAEGYNHDQRYVSQQWRQVHASSRHDRPSAHDERIMHGTGREPRRDGETRNENDATRRRWWPVLVPLALLAIGVSLATPGGRHQWAVSIFRQPTPYTELSFENAVKLPKTAVSNKPISVSFSISNNEGKLVHYHYVVNESPAGASKVLASGTKNIAAGTTSTIPVTVRPGCPSSPCKVKVSLLGYPETIDFLVNLK